MQCIVQERFNVGGSFFPHASLHLPCCRQRRDVKEALSSRLERLVVQRVRRASFLSSDFQRRGRFALGALDPDAIEDLEAQVSAAVCARACVPMPRCGSVPVRDGGCAYLSPCVLCGSVVCMCMCVCCARA